MDMILYVHLHTPEYGRQISRIRDDRQPRRSCTFFIGLIIETRLLVYFFLFIARSVQLRDWCPVTRGSSGIVPGNV